MTETKLVLPDWRYLERLRHNSFVAPQHANQTLSATGLLGVDAIDGGRKHLMTGRVPRPRWVAHHGKHRAWGRIKDPLPSRAVSPVLLRCAIQATFNGTWKIVDD